MLPRRHIRIKVFQTLYSYIQKKEETLTIKNEFKKNLQSYLELYHIVIDFLVLFKEVASDEIDIKLKKFFPTDEDLKPNKRFVKNKILSNLKLKKNKDIDYDKLKRIIKKIFKKIEKSTKYIKFMNSKNNSINHDRKFIIYLLRKYLITNEKIHEFIEEYSIYCNDDLVIVYHTIIEKLNNEQKLRSNKIFRNPEDKLFAKNLLNFTLKNNDKLNSNVFKLVKNWDIERIALSDLILIKMAISENLFIKNIPYKVTLDEYIEISKDYSTPKSKEFINGILDVFMKDILAEQ
tara:strand:+ start:23568 stop:24440 length:873 start_codon:yes stop_codon:yes gene_type:complete